MIDYKSCHERRSIGKSGSVRSSSVGRIGAPSYYCGGCVSLTVRSIRVVRVSTSLNPYNFHAFRSARGLIPRESEAMSAAGLTSSPAADIPHHVTEDVNKWRMFMPAPNLSQRRSNNGSGQPLTAERERVESEVNQ